MYTQLWFHYSCRCKLQTQPLNDRCRCSARCEFFQREVNDPEQLSELIGNLKKLNREELDSINTLVRNMCKKK